MLPGAAGAAGARRGCARQSRGWSAHRAGSSGRCAGRGSVAAAPPLTPCADSPMFRLMPPGPPRAARGKEDDRHAQPHLTVAPEGPDAVPPGQLPGRQMGRGRQRQDPRGEEPRHRRSDRRSAGHGHRGNQTSDRGRQPRLARLARHAGEGTRRHPAQAQRPDAGQRGRPGGDHDRRTGQAAGREQGRDRLRRQLHRVVRRGSQARLWRHHPAERQGPPHHRAEGADRRVRRDHAVEFPLAR